MMLRAKDWVLILGIAVACLGFTCLPSGQRANGEMNRSLFAQSADAGAFLSIGAVMLMIGALIVALSLFMPRR